MLVPYQQVPTLQKTLTLAGSETQDFLPLLRGARGLKESKLELTVVWSLILGAPFSGGYQEGP